MSGHALVLGDGEPPTRAGLDAAWPGWDENVTRVVAADGGARLAAALGLRLDRWVGDGDSYPLADVERLAAAGVSTRLVPSAKDESDLELAVLEVADAATGTDRITILGGLGGPRVDHELANVALLAHPGLAGIEVTFLGDRARVRLLTAPDVLGGPTTGTFRGRPGDLVSLLPLDPVVEGVTTDGLEYPLSNEPLILGPARGLSNVRTRGEAAVTVRTGRLLVIETPATVAR